MSDSTVDLTESRSGELIVVSWVFTGIAIAVVLMKIFARARIIQRMGWDDFFIFISLVFSILASAFVTYSAYLGLGRHTVALMAEEGGAEKAVTIGLYQMLGYPFNILSFTLPNLSIAILVNNLLDRNTIRSRILIGLVVLQIVFAVISVMILFLMCTPTKALWDKSITGKCLSSDVMTDFSYWLSAYTTVIDIILAAIPIKAFWKLQMKPNTKIGLCIMMGLTLLSAVITVIKATYLWLLFGAVDFYYDLTPLVIWGLVEQNVVIVAACVPTLRPFFHKAFKRHKSSQETGSQYYATGKSRSYFRSRTDRLSKAGSEVPLDNVQAGYSELSESTDVDSRQDEYNAGIWRTVDVRMEWNQEEGGAEPVGPERPRAVAKPS